MNFLDACFLCVAFTEQRYISRPCGMKCLFSETFLYINLPGIAPKKAVVAVLITVIMKFVSLARRKFVRTIHVVQMQCL